MRLVLVEAFAILLRLTLRPSATVLEFSLSCCVIRQTPGGLLLPSAPSSAVVFQRLDQDPGEAPLHHLPLHLPQPGPVLRALAG